MPTVHHDRLRTIADRLLQCAGAGEEEAGIIARHVIGANLAGHDSHGIIQAPTYIDRIKRGHIVPGAPFDVVNETPSTLVVDGHWGFGYSVSERAMRLTIEKAKAQGTAAATVYRQSHVGRVADYPLMAVREGMIGLMTADSGRTAKAVAPFGGSEPRLGTNPICVAVPSNLEGAAIHRHGHERGRRGESRTRHGARDVDPRGMGGRQRREPHDRPARAAGAGRGAPSARRIRGVQGAMASPSLSRFCPAY